mgnify:CR=1 FL=1
MGAIEHPPIVRLPGIPDHVTYTWLVMIVLATLAFLASRRLALVPRGLQNAMEVVLEQFQGLIDDVIGPEGRPYLPLIATLGLFILTGNLLGLVPTFESPTMFPPVPLGCALASFLYFNMQGFREQGPIGYAKHFAGPIWWLAWLMFPIEIISTLARPLSLTIRLYANTFAGEQVTLAFLAMVPLGIPVIFYGLHVFVAFLQAYIFTLMTMIYVQGAVSHEH